MVASHVQAALVAVVSVVLGAHYTGYWSIPTRTVPTALGDTERLNCRPFLPKLFVDAPPSAANVHIQRAAKALDKHFTKRFSKGDISSLSVAVVTSGGPVFEQNWGVMRGNESATSPATHSHSSYRIASVSKLLLVLEAYILHQKGALSWDDPIDKFLPGFKYRAEAFSPSPLHQDLPHDKAPMTVFQLGM